MAEAQRTPDGPAEPPREPPVDIAVRVAVLPGRQRALDYALTNRSGRDLLLFRPLARYADGALVDDETLEIRWHAHRAPGGVRVQCPPVPFLTRLAAGARLVGTAALPQPLAVDHPYRVCALFGGEREVSIEPRAVARLQVALGIAEWPADGPEGAPPAAPRDATTLWEGAAGEPPLWPASADDPAVFATTYAWAQAHQRIVRAPPQRISLAVIG